MQWPIVVISNTTRRFDLYDFFSVLLPGLSLLLGLLPFAPTFLDLSSPQAVVPGLVLGFIFGRAIHSIAVSLEDYFDRTTHRERFAQQLANPSFVAESTVERFCEECTEVFEDVDLDEDEQPLVEDEKRADTLYTLVRSYIHIDSRGRSRSFQAIYAFYRSMWVVAVILALSYVLYGFGNAMGVNTGIPYTSHIGQMGFSLNTFVLVSEVGLLAAFKTFSEARGQYQEYYVQYLISDFLVLQTADYPDSIVVAEKETGDS